MNLTRNRLLLFLSDLARRPYNALGVWLLRRWLALPADWVNVRRNLGLTVVAAARARAVPPICPSFEEWQRRPGSRRAVYLLLYPESRVRHPAPRTCAPGGRDPWRLRRYDNTRCAAAFVAGVPHGTYYGPVHDIFSPEPCLLPELSFYGPENAFRESRDYLQRYRGGLPPAPAWPGVTATLAAPYADANYFHWMFHVLPRFELLRLAGVRHEQVTRYLLNPLRHPFHAETLARLSVPADKVVAAEADTRFEAEFLWTTSSLRLSSHMSAWVHDFLRREFLGAASPAQAGEALPAGYRLFVSRANASQRRLVNEDEIVARLAALGFRPVTLEAFSVAEQARLFAGASAIVAAHGAGLTNLVFASPGARVIELFSPRRRATYYWEMSNARSLDYFYLIGEDASDAADPQAFRVPLAQLDPLLEAAKI